MEKKNAQAHPVEPDRPLLKKRLVRYDTKPKEFGETSLPELLPLTPPQRISAKTGKVIYDADPAYPEVLDKSAEMKSAYAGVIAKSKSFRDAYQEALAEVEGRVDPQEAFIAEETVIETYTAEGLQMKKAQILKKRLTDSIDGPAPERVGSRQKL